MADLFKTNARSQALELEAFIKSSSSKLQNVLVPGSGGGIHAIVNRLSKRIVTALFGLVLLLRHDGAALWAFIGSILNYALSITMKRILNQGRPVTTQRSDPGMPSSHAQSFSYISVFTVLSVVECLGTNELSLLVSSLILALGSYFTWLRVSQNLHTTNQVVVGAIFGSVNSTLWYVTWNSYVHEAFTSSFSVQVSIFLASAASVLVVFKAG